MKKNMFLDSRKKLLFLVVSIIVSTALKAQTTAFKVKGLHLDFRTQVMSVSAIKELAKDLSERGINTLVMEYEATFPFNKHATLCNEYAYTESEITDLVPYCTRLGIDLIPLQNCFGHCEYILRHDRYAVLREDNKEVSQVCPLKIKEQKRFLL